MSMLYTPLDSTREIRLLRLHSRHSSSTKSLVQIEKNVPIYCDLYPVAVREARNQGYEALSYTWGTPEEPLSIQVNGTEVPVTRNLHVALQHLRGETSEVVLWVDALCINQMDDAEKIEQVNMMREIYACAKSTRVWLGPADETSDEIMVQLARIGKTVIDRGAFDLFIRMTTLSIKDPSGAAQAEDQVTKLVEDMLDRSLAQLEDSCRLLTEFCNLLSRPYWSRVWILQEIVVSRNVEVYCGKRKIGFAFLHAAMLYLIYMQTSLSTQLVKPLTALLEASADGNFPPDCKLKAQFDYVISIEIPPSASLVSGMRLRYHDPAQENGEAKPILIQLLARTRVGREATDPRDRIWALLGMAADTGTLRITPNYADTNSCTAVYCNATRAMIASGHIDILAFSQWSKKDPMIPSWVPDWREEVKQPFGQLPWDTPYSASGAAKFLKHLDQIVPVLHLKVNGFLVDSIESLRPQCNNGEWLSMQHRHEACIYLQDIISLCHISDEKLATSGVEIYANPSVRESAYQRVPVADLYSTGFVRRATIDECHLGHTEVVTDYIQWKNRRPSTGAPVTNTLRSYYIMMGQQIERRPFVTMKGFVGLAPKHVEEGDVIVIFPGAKFPYVLRRCDDGTYVLVGETFVYGIMYGELVTEDREMEEFILK
ncbi:Heterokaryon incompatibility protein [Venustampulla echinocandica]|uniref:Heterokaryon incompatibility protein n=1 Tax=Venustampulla echinocandica TaxID=2656787 RepID=A0A370T9Z2_9HELO|nr:Heterokaryon incompatibility protein [Venustampulla echinocandica]RDL30488.1 Heterokaryon incompatibility protein [Venustampulla echinocandica]